jgi:hypothetical protein
MRLRILPLILFFAFTSVVVKVFDAVIEKANSPHENFVNKFQALAQENKTSDKEEAPPAENADDSEKKGTEEEKNAKSDDKEKLPKAEKVEEEAVLSPGYSGAGPKELDVSNSTEMEKTYLEICQNAVKNWKNGTPQSR